jgi:hypothetical protein
MDGRAEVRPAEVTVNATVIARNILRGAAPDRLPAWANNIIRLSDRQKFEFLQTAHAQEYIPVDAYAYLFKILNRRLNHKATKTERRHRICAEADALKNQHDFVAMMCREAFGCEPAKAPQPAGEYAYWQARFCGWDVLAVRRQARKHPYDPLFPDFYDVAEQLRSSTSDEWGCVERRLPKGEQAAPERTAFWIQWSSASPKFRRSVVQIQQEMIAPPTPHEKPTGELYREMAVSILMGERVAILYNPAFNL